MTCLSAMQVKRDTGAASLPSQASLLTRKCACGAALRLDGHCPSCRGSQPGNVSVAAQASAYERAALDRRASSPEHDFSAVSVSSRGPRRQEGDDSPTVGDNSWEREHFCLADADPTQPSRKDFESREAQRAMFGLWNARSLATQAYTNLGHHDPYHLRLAESAFGQAVTHDLLDEGAARIRNELDSLRLRENLVAGTCDDPGCNPGRNAVAYTPDDLSGVVLCPFYFIQPARTLATTYLHEAGHMANIDLNFTPGSERYCRGDDTIECDAICPLNGENLLENVDAWARFLYCVAMSG